MTPNGGGLPTGDLLTAIDFWNFWEFKQNLVRQNNTICSGWAWLCVHKGGKLDVCGTQIKIIH
jgi:Fe-Mn family superoxide dismutase